MLGRRTDACRRPRAERRAGLGGFTLIELLVIVAVLGTIAAIGGPMLNSSVDSARVSAAAGEVAAALDYARLTASSGGRPCRVTIDAAADTLSVDLLKSGVNFADPGLTEVLRSQAEAVSYVQMWHPVRRGFRYRVDFGDAAGFAGVNVVVAAFGGGSSVVFDERGAPSAAGTVVLERGGRTATVTLDGLTGKVTRND